jgi:hypothetical protein
MDIVEAAMRSLSLTTLAMLLAGLTAANAAIRIADSRYEDGVLIVTGQTRPDQKVTLDGKYKTKADGGGHFEFHVKNYKPRFCMSDITAGEDTYSAVIAGCLLSDAAANYRSDAPQAARKDGTNNSSR